MAAETMRITEEIVVEDKSGSGIESAKAKVTAFDKTVQQTQTRLSKMSGSRWNVTMNAVDKATTVISKVESKISGAIGKAWNFTVGLIDKVTTPLQGVFNLLKNPLLQAGAVLGVTISLSDSISTFGGFESTMSQVQAISGASAEDMADLTALAKEMGATTKFTAQEAAEGLTYMAMAGWKTDDMLTSLSGVMNLAAASGENLGTVSDIVTDAMTAFGLAADGVTESGVSNAMHFSDVLAAASSNANTTVAGMGDTFKYVGSMAGALGYDIESVALMTGLMANQSVKGTMAGTSLNAILTRLSTNTSGATDAIRKLGVEFFNSDGSARDLTTVMTELREATAYMSAEEKSALANTVAGMEAQKGFLAILNTSTEDYNTLAAAIYNADGAAEEMSRTMMDNLQGSMEYLRSAIDGVKIKLGERLSPYLREFVDWLTSKMPMVEDMVSSVMDRVDSKISDLRDTIREFTSSDEWADADVWGKISIAWDKIVAEPFSNWWGNTGKPWLVGKVGDVGESIGSGITNGLLAILGFDAGNALDEGKSIGHSFVQGIKEGFDMEQITSALMNWAGDHKGIVAAAGVLLGGKILGGLSNAFQGGKSFVGDIRSIFSGVSSGAGGLLGSAASYSTASMVVNAGTVVVNGSGGLPGLGGVGGVGETALKNGTVLTGTGGALKTGLATLGVNLGSSATSLTGAAAVGGGAVAGLAASALVLGSAAKDFYNASQASSEAEKGTDIASGTVKAGGVAAGALAGAAIGSIVPVIGTAAGALIGAGVGGIGGWLLGNKFKKDYEKDMADAEEATRALALRQEQAKYSSQELKDALADTNVTADEFAALYREKVADTLRSHFGDMKLTSTEINDIAKAITNLGDGAQLSKYSDAATNAAQSFKKIQSYVSGMDKINWKIGVGLELSESEMSSYTESLAGVYHSVQEYLENSQYEVTSAVKVLFDPEAELNFTGLNTMYEQFQQQLSDLGQTFYATVNVALEDGVITLDEQAEIQSIQDQITAIAEKVNSAQTEASLEALKIKFNGAALDADSFAELQGALQTQVETATSQYDEALQISIASLKLQLDEGVIDQESYDAQLQALADGYQGKISDLQMQVESFQLDAIADAFSTELDGILPDIEGTTSEKLGTALHNALASGVDVTTWDQETAARWLGLESLQSEAQGAIIDRMSALAATLPTTISDSVSLEFADADLISGPPNTAFSNSIAAWDADSATAPLGVKIAASMPTAIAEQDYTPVGTAFGTGVGSAIEGTDMGPIQAGIDTVHSNTGSAIDSKFSSGFDTTTTIRVTANYVLTNPSATLTTSGGGSATVTASLRAEGGYVNGAELSWIGEDGPEYVIPVGSKRRDRGLSLWYQAGEALGVGGHADGGVVGDTEDFTTGTSYGPREAAGTTEVNAPISINLSPEIVVQATEGMNADDVVQIIKERIREMVDDISDEMAEKLAQVFANMPVRGGA